MKSLHVYIAVIVTSLFVSSFFSCGQSSNKTAEEGTAKEQEATNHTAYQNALRQNMLECDEMDDKNKKIALQIREEQHGNLKKDVLSWMQGTWAYNGRVHVYGSYYTDMTAKLVIDGNYIVSYGNGEVYDEGTIRDIDMEEQRVTFGSQSYFEFDNESRTIYTGTRQEGTRYRKVSSSSDNRSSHTGSSSSGSTTTFSTSSEVMAYLGNRFKNSAGNVITVKHNCLFSNGNQITNAIRVERFNGSRATLTATSPYTVGTLYFTVDASRGTFTDGSGDVFYIQ